MPSFMTYFPGTTPYNVLIAPALVRSLEPPYLRFQLPFAFKHVPGPVSLQVADTRKLNQVG